MIPIAAGAAAAIVLLWVVVIFNRFARLSNLVRESWSDVDVALQRRHDLIPNLVNVVKGYAAFEQATLQRVIDARNVAVSRAQSLPLQAQTEAVLTQALSGLFMRVEAYPQLKASGQFASLQQELADTEDRIAAARRFYNANARDYNIALKTFPGSLFAGSRAPADFFEADNASRDPIHVSFAADPPLTQ